jgi:DNA-binding SARP family transcriptional activator
VEIRILGELEVIAGDGRRIEVFGRRQRTLLALLATSPGHAVSIDSVVDALWAPTPPANEANAVQTVVSRLRRAVGDGCVATLPPGYVLRVDADDVDASRFERLADEGRRALADGDVETAAAALRAALSLWRGSPLAEFIDADFARFEVMRLDERRLSALEDRVDTDLLVGRHRDVVGELEVLATENPLRERIQAQRLLALYRSGRQADALARYRELAELLRDRHGLEPGRGLRDLERQMLRQDLSLDPSTAVPVRPRPAERGAGRARPTTRRIVTVVVVELDELAERGTQVDLLAAVQTALERHGGAVEHLPGGAVAAFGLDQSHEDDAARAVRAAAAVTATLEIAVRVGIASGEIVADSDWYVTASAVSEALRLARRALAGEVLIDVTSVRLAQRVAEFEPDAPRGGFRLATLPDAEPRPRPLGTTPFVNREGERARLMLALTRAIERQSTQLITVLGPPGVGKSRLVREFLDAIGMHATVAVGRSLSYGESTSTFTVDGVVRCLVGEQIGPGLAARLAGVERGAQIADRVTAAIGAGGRGGPGEEIQWAFRRLLETVAAERALVVALDDVHWSEPWLLDLIEYLAAFATGPIVLIACARPELLALRPGWVGPEAQGEVLALEPLSDTHTRQLVEEMLVDRGTPPGAVARITRRSEGNPLFAEQIVAFELDHSFAAGDTVPTTLRSLLQERVDDLRPHEHDLLGRAAVEGVVFHRGALAALAEPGTVDDQAAALALMRKGFISPAHAQVPGDDAFRFRHALLRDAVYEALPKDRRRNLHIRFADWLEEVAPDHAILGHHLRSAWLYASELREADETREALGSRAAAHVVAAAEAAVARSALPAAAELFRQAAEMLAASAPARTKALVELGSTLLTTGQLEGARAALDGAWETARASGDAVGEAYADVLDVQLQLQVEADTALVRIPAATGSAARTFRRYHDDLGMFRVYHTRALAHWFACRCQAASDDWMRAASHARRSGRAGIVPENILGWVASALHQGPQPVPSAIERCEELLGETRNYPLKQASVRRQLGVLYAMDGDFDRAQAALEESERLFDEMGNTVHSAARDREADAAMLEGDVLRAERLLRESIERLEAMGDRLHLPVILGLLARALLAQGRLEEADELTDTTEQLAAQYDVSAQVSSRATRARILAQRGDAAEAERVARTATEIAADSDWLLGRADAAESLAVAHAAAGRDADAYQASAEALSLYELKGARVLADAARSALHAQRRRGLEPSVVDRQP